MPKRYPNRVNTAAKMLKYGREAGIGVFKQPPPKSKRKPFNERAAERLQAQENRPGAEGTKGGKVE